MRTLSARTFIACVSLLSSVTLNSASETSSVSPDAALAKLKEGNHRFVTNNTSTSKPTTAKRVETIKAQHPFAIIVGCADSRTTPEIVFDENLGDLFVIRTAGNLVDDHCLGSVEYAVEHLGTRLVVVLGHSHCGAVTAALAGPSAPGHELSLVRDIQPAVQAVQGQAGDKLSLAVAENARRVAASIRSEANLGEHAHDVRVVAAVYDLDTGKIEWLKE